MSEGICWINPHSKAHDFDFAGRCRWCNAASLETAVNGQEPQEDLRPTPNQMLLDLMEYVVYASADFETANFQCRTLDDVMVMEPAPMATSLIGVAMFVRDQVDRELLRLEKSFQTEMELDEQKDLMLALIARLVKNIWEDIDGRDDSDEGSAS